jgi:hypothetical protein
VAEEPKQKIKKHERPPPTAEAEALAGAEAEAVAGEKLPKIPFKRPKGKNMPRYPPEPWSPMRAGVSQVASRALRPPCRELIPGIFAPFCTANCMRVTDAVLVRSV